MDQKGNQNQSNPDATNKKSNEATNTTDKENKQKTDVNVKNTNQSEGKVEQNKGQSDGTNNTQNSTKTQKHEELKNDKNGEQNNKETKNDVQKNTDAQKQVQQDKKVENASQVQAQGTQNQAQSNLNQTAQNDKTKEKVASDTTQKNLDAQQDKKVENVSQVQAQGTQNQVQSNLSQAAQIDKTKEKVVPDTKDTKNANDKQVQGDKGDKGASQTQTQGTQNQVQSNLNQAAQIDKTKEKVVPDTKDTKNVNDKQIQDNNTQPKQTNAENKTDQKPQEQNQAKAKIEQGSQNDKIQEKNNLEQNKNIQPEVSNLKQTNNNPEAADQTSKKQAQANEKQTKDKNEPKDEKSSAPTAKRDSNPEKLKAEKIDAQENNNKKGANQKNGESAPEKSKIPQKANEKDNKERKNSDKEVKNDKKSTKVPQTNLTGALSSILNFFSSAAQDITKSTEKTTSKLTEIFMDSRIGSTLRGVEYKPTQTKANEDQAGQKKRQMMRVNKSQDPKQAVKNILKINNDKSKKVILYFFENINFEKTLKLEANEKAPVGKEGDKPPTTKSYQVPKLKVRPEGSPSPKSLKGKDEVEEQIRLHKIQEIKKMKKVLAEKMDALNRELMTLERPIQLKQLEEASQIKLPQSYDELRKEQKAQELEREKKALEFAKKMNQQRKEMEHKREKRREVQQALVLKDIDVLYQKQLDNLEALGGDGSAKTKKENNIKKFKQENLFAALEVQKQNIKLKREFEKTAEESEIKEEQKPKLPKKQIYKSPILDQVLKSDAEIKQTDLEKARERKELQKKRLEYAKEVKSSYLPKVHTQFDSNGKLIKASHKSQNVEEYLVRVAGKDQLYGYLDKMRNKYPDLANPNRRKSSNGDSQTRADPEHHVSNYKLKNHYKKQMEDNYELDNEAEAYELEDNWNISDRTREKDTNKDRNYNYYSKSSEKNKGSNKNRDVSKKDEHMDDNDNDDDDNDDNRDWEEELQQDQVVLKNKISSMLNDIKKMENQIKTKEEMLLHSKEKKE